MASAAPPPMFVDCSAPRRGSKEAAPAELFLVAGEGVLGQVQANRDSQSQAILFEPLHARAGDPVVDQRFREQLERALGCDGKKADGESRFARVIVADARPAVIACLVQAVRDCAPQLFSQNRVFVMKPYPSSQVKRSAFLRAYRLATPAKPAKPRAAEKAEKA